MMLTQEQLEILSNVKQMCANEILKINAFAGTGKTSTLMAITKALPHKQFLYLAFNRSIVQECKMKFPANVTILTTHSLAFKKIALPYYIQQGQEIHDGNYKPAQIANLYGVENLLAYEALCVLEEFFTSDTRELSSRTSDAHTLAYTIYRDMIEHRRDITHSFYLKQYQLLQDKEHPKYDYILLDEGQDTNDVTLDIFLNFDAAKIIVGDTHQAIYGWRGAQNAMDKVQADANHYLSTTFRCAQHIVDRANFVLKNYKSEDVKIISGCSLEPKDESYAVITRTNAKIIENIAEYEDEYRLVKCPQSIFETAITLHFWLNGAFEKITNPSFEYLKTFKNKTHLDQYIEETNSIELKSSLLIAQRYKKSIFAIYKKAKNAYRGNLDQSKKSRNEKDSQIFLLSGHTSKGLEFDSVELENDFPALKEIYQKESKSTQELTEEANLYYVALTRAKYKLTDNSKNHDLFDS